MFVRWIRCLEQDYWSRLVRECALLSSIPCRIHRMGTNGFQQALVLSFPLEWTLMCVFLIFAAAAGRWAVGVCMVCPANTVLTAFQGIRQ